MVANDRLHVWSGQSWGDLQSAQLFPRRSLAQADLERIKSTLKTYVSRVGSQQFPRYMIVTEDDEAWNGESFGNIRSAIVYAHRNLAERDAARIEAENSDFFHDEGS